MQTPPLLERKIAENWPPVRWSDESVVVAVSGGADSTALCRALAALRPPEARGKLIVAHLNHQLRGPESDADEAFVGALAAQLPCEFTVERAAVGAAADERGDGLEEAARARRYEFLTAVALRHQARYVVTAHTLDDQAETVLQRILRGTGTAGLAGIPRARALAGGGVGLVRPLLKVRRSEVLEYLQALGQPYRDDSSNTDPRYTRNRIRHELLPQLAAEYNPRIVETLARLATQAEELQEALAPAVENLIREAVSSTGVGRFELECTKLTTQPRHLVREVLIAAWTAAGLPLQAMGFDEWDALAEMAQAAGPAKRMFPGGVTAERIWDKLNFRG